MELENSIGHGLSSLEVPHLPTQVPRSIYTLFRIVLRILIFTADGRQQRDEDGQHGGTGAAEDAMRHSGSALPTDAAGGVHEHVKQYR